MKRAFECAYKIMEGHGLTAAYVVDPGRDWRYRRLLGGQIVSAMWGVGDYAEHRIDDDVDVSEVAFHLAVIVEVDLFSVENGARESKQRHVRAAPGAVDCEKAKAGGGNTEEVGVAVRHQLVGSLRRGVQADWMVGRAGLAEGDVTVQPIDRAGGGVDQMTNRRLPDRFEHAQEAMYVVQRIRKRRGTIKGCGNKKGR